MMKMIMGGLLFSALITAVHAHNVVSGVYADGLMIEGEVGFSNGDMAKAGALVEIFDESGQTLGTTQLEEGGVFTFQADRSQQHVFKVDLGAGHVANMVLEAAELVDVTAKTTIAKQVNEGTEKQDPATTVTVSDMSAEALESLVRRAVAQQVRPLQKELRAYKEKVFFRDIAGGLGFIVGLFGVAAWVASRRPEANL